MLVMQRSLSWQASSTSIRHTVFGHFSYFFNIKSPQKQNRSVENCSVLQTEFVTLYIKSKSFTCKKAIQMYVKNVQLYSKSFKSNLRGVVGARFPWHTNWRNQNFSRIWRSSKIMNVNHVASRHIHYLWINFLSNSISIKSASNVSRPMKKFSFLTIEPSNMINRHGSRYHKVLSLIGQ